MGSSITIPVHSHQVGTYYVLGQTLVQLTHLTPTHFVVVTQPCITYSNPALGSGSVMGEYPLATLKQLRSLTAPQPDLHVLRRVGEVCEALWGTTWKVSRITYVGLALELQCADEDYELPMEVCTRNLAPMGTHLSIDAAHPPIRSTHRERMAALVYEEDVLRLRIKLANHEAIARARVSRLSADLAATTSPCA